MLDGGLGFKNLEEQNCAFLMKPAFGLVFRKDELWVRVLQNKYKCRDIVPSSLVRRGCSHLWKGVAGVWDQVRHHAIWNVGNGEVIDFWRSPWVADIGLLADWLIFTDYSSFGFHSFEFYGSNEWGLDLVAF
ncbi:hypothetical protein V6N12_024363 [Hibiscus sabdariffa]|uniref:Uncharacterized protein n=1 Tax=Hibiscus sabdariffa TaxID=183260 RepID=A0ABR2G0B8_9ROSI